MEDGVPIVRVADVKHGVVSTVDPMRVSPTIEALHSRTRLRGGELLMTLVGTVGEMAIASSDIAGWNVARAIGVIPVRHDVGPRWVRYMLESPASRARVSARLNTTVQATLNLRDLGALPIAMPPDGLRSAITAILGSIDDKIELNRRVTETLHEMTRALFRDWFIDFGPVLAKSEGRQRYMASHIWEMFPSALCDSPLGLAPATWTPSTLKFQTTKIGSGATPRGGKAVYVERGVALIRSQNIYDDDFVWDGLARITDEAAEQLAGVEVQTEDVLLNITGASILRTCVATSVVLPARVNQHVAIIRARRGVPSRFLHLHLMQEKTRNYLLGMNAGGSREAVTKAHIESVPLLMPSPSLLEEFGKVVAPMYQQIDELAAESRTLANCRDQLLPKLISGDIRIKDADRFIEEATA